MLNHFKKQTKKDNIFDVVVFILVFILTMMIAYPLYFVIIASVSDPGMVQNGEVLLYPRGISFEGYKYILRDSRIWMGYLNTTIYTVGGALLGIAITIPAGFALSKKHLWGRKIFMLFFMVTMYFGGGLIPTYLVIDQLGLVGTRAILIILGSFSVYNMIVTRSFFSTSLPAELQEAAEIDGCSIFRFFFTIAIPLSKAIIAIMTLYYAVGHWNDFFNGLIYSGNNNELYPLQLIMRDILLSGQMINPAEVIDQEQLEMMIQRALTIRYGVIIVASLPILAFYPFVQRYFVKGVMIGSLKG